MFGYNSPIGIWEFNENQSDCTKLSSQSNMMMIMMMRLWPRFVLCRRLAISSTLGCIFCFVLEGIIYANRERYCRLLYTIDMSKSSSINSPLSPTLYSTILILFNSYSQAPYYLHSGLHTLPFSAFAQASTLYSPRISSSTSIPKHSVTLPTLVNSIDP